MTGTAFLEKPIDCTEEERRRFARLVRQGFEGSTEGLNDRVGRARWLAFHYAASGELAAVAARPRRLTPRRGLAARRAHRISFSISLSPPSVLLKTTPPGEIECERVAARQRTDGFGRPAREVT